MLYDEDVFKRKMISNLVEIIYENFPDTAKKLKPSEILDIMAYIMNVLMEVLDQHSKNTFVHPLKKGVE